MQTCFYCETIKVVFMAKGIFGFISSIYDIYRDIRNFYKMSPAKKQEMDYADALADENAVDAYNRDLEFYDTRLSPEQQIRSTALGYDAAGINRMALAGSSPGATTSSSASAGSPSASGNPSTPVDIMGAVSAVMGLKMKKDYNDAEIARIGQETEGKRIENKYREEREKYELNLLKEQIANTRASTQKLAADTGYAQMLALYAPALLEANVSESESRIALNKSMESLNVSQKREVDEKVKNHAKERRLMDAQIDKIYEEILNLASEREVNEQSIEESKARISKMEKEIEKIGKDIGLSDLDIKYYIWNHPRENTLPFGFKWNRSSENGRNGYNPAGLTDEEILTAARARGLIPSE